MTKTDQDGRAHLALAIVDHASRACLRLQRLQDKSSLRLLQELVQAVKRALASEPIADGHAISGALMDIRAWYNHDRPHDHLKGRTPAEVWAGIDVFAAQPRTGTVAGSTDVPQESG